jgi:murein DD-endopeptidase MepM/ murein hydrolase activator NlpD
MAHKKHKAKYVSFLIVPDNQKKPRNFRIRIALLRIILIGVAVIVGLMILSAVSYWKMAEIVLDKNRLEEENFKMRKSLQQMDNLKEDLTHIKQFEKQIRGSLKGYVTVERISKQDTVKLEKLDFNKMNIDQQRTIFNSIPSLMPVEGFMTRGFKTSSLFTEPHLGLDIAAPTGTSIRATADGVVMFSGWTDDGGFVLIIEHGYGFFSIYKHNERNLVNELERVSKGQVIASLGNTGEISSGAHLHYAIWRDGFPVDPISYINK